MIIVVSSGFLPRKSAAARVTMRRAVEAVLPEAVLLVVLLADGVVAHVVGHRLVEGGVEDADVRDAGEDRLAGANAADVGGHVERAKRDERVELRERRVVDEGGFLEDLAAVQDAVADGVDLGEGLEDADGGVDELLRDERERLGVIVRLDGLLALLVARAGVDEVGVVGADALDEALGENGLLGHVEEGELEGRGTGVDDEDVADGLLAGAGHGEGGLGMMKRHNGGHLPAAVGVAGR